MELKQIVPYLPHGLMFYCMDEDSGEYGVLPLVSIDIALEELEIGNMTVPVDEIGSHNGLTVKPVLRDFSNLLTEISSNGEKFIPAKRLAEIAIEKGYYKPTYANSVDEYSYKIVQKPFGKILKITDFEEWVLIVSLSDMGRNKKWVVDLLYEWHFDVEGFGEIGVVFDLRDLK